jgi:hypothetical protein
MGKSCANTPKMNNSKEISAVFIAGGIRSNDLKANRQKQIVRKSDDLFTNSAYLSESARKKTKGEMRLKFGHYAILRAWALTCILTRWPVFAIKSNRLTISRL